MSDGANRFSKNTKHAARAMHLNVLTSPCVTCTLPICIANTCRIAGLLGIHDWFWFYVARGNRFNAAPSVLNQLFYGISGNVIKQDKLNKTRSLNVAKMKLRIAKGCSYSIRITYLRYTRLFLIIWFCIQEKNENKYNGKILDISHWLNISLQVRAHAHTHIIRQPQWVSSQWKKYEKIRFAWKIAASLLSIWSCGEDKTGILLQCTQGQQLFFTPEHNFNIQMCAHTHTELGFAPLSDTSPPFRMCDQIRTLVSLLTSLTNYHASSVCSRWQIQL